MLFQRIVDQSRIELGVDSEAAKRLLPVEHRSAADSLELVFECRRPADPVEAAVWFTLRLWPEVPGDRAAVATLCLYTKQPQPWESAQVPLLKVRGGSAAAGVWEAERGHRFASELVVILPERLALTDKISRYHSELIAETVRVLLLLTANKVLDTDEHWMKT